MIPKIYSSSLGLLVILGLSLVAATGTVEAQNRPDGRGRGLPFGGGGGPLELLQRGDVQAELELLDDQKESVRELARTSNERRRDMFGGFAAEFRNRDASEEERQALRDKVRQAMEKLNQETEAGLDFLLPHQRQRLSQLEVQFRMRGGGTALGSREVGEKLALTDEQREKLRDKSRELGQDFAKKVAELRRRMQEQLLAELSPEQQATFKEMVGDPFEFRDRQPGPGGGQRAPRAGGERPQRP